MKILFIQFVFSLIFSSSRSFSFGNVNGANLSPVFNLKSTDEVLCKMDDGRIEIPVNGKIRSNTNPCKVCTCTVTGFLCEDQCETIAASTSTESTTVSTTTTTTTTTTSTTTITTTTFSVDQFLLLSSIAPNSNSNSKSISTSNDDTISNCFRTLGTGVTVSREYSFVDCSEVYLSGKRTSGIYEIWPRLSSKPFRVFCDMETDGGGWTVIQRRDDFPQQSNFFVSWSSYKRGFGDLSRDFWLGNEKIYALTNQDEYRLHIDLHDFNDQSRFVDYEWFFITNEQSKYTLNLGSYLPTSTGGDSLTYNRGMRFTTRDQDNDQSMSGQCAEKYRSGWWHTSCTLANLNGLYLRGNDSTAMGVFWSSWLGGTYSLKSCEIKIRPTSYNQEMLS